MPCSLHPMHSHSNTTVSHLSFPRALEVSNQSCAPTNWWSAAALGSLMTGGGGAPRIFHRRRRRGFMVGGGGVRPDERALKQRTRWFYRGQPLVISAGPLASKT